MNYKKAGVDIDKANQLVAAVKGMIKKSHRPGVLGGVGGFGAFFDLSSVNLKNTVFVSSCDGVGTKLKIAFLSGIHHTVGIDLVAMSVNDVLCSGAEPLFFLDYLATGKIEATVYKEIIKGIVEGCQQARCALVGGETAEMPGMYKVGEYDLAGFCVGAVAKTKILGSNHVKLGDAVIGLESSGLHSNGFSLVRKVFTPVELKARSHELLTPTRIYTKPLLGILKKFNAKNFNIKAAAHITGGAFYDKASRIVPKNLSMVLYKNAWSRPEIFDEIQERVHMADKEMYRTFNMGIGMILVVRDSMKMEVVRELSRLGCKSRTIGEMVSGVGGVVIV
ncbi:MAG: phosphoribosylformylglycinamidine cyclo-ligase [Candidatus Omnitrophota bacterium]